MEINKCTCLIIMETEMKMKQHWSMNRIKLWCSSKKKNSNIYLKKSRIQHSQRCKTFQIFCLPNLFFITFLIKEKTSKSSTYWVTEKFRCRGIGSDIQKVKVTFHKVKDPVLNLSHLFTWVYWKIQPQHQSKAILNNLYSKSLNYFYTGIFPCTDRTSEEEIRYSSWLL